MTTTASPSVHKSVEERAAEGETARKQVRRSSHSGWSPAADRPDPVGDCSRSRTQPASPTSSRCATGG